MLFVRGARWLVALGVAIPAVGCERDAGGGAAPGGHPVLQDSVAAAGTDDFGREIRPGAAQRIVSLNPALTEILVAIGAEDRLVGRTAWDLYTPVVRGVRDLGPGIRPNVEAILETRPDLVVLYASTDNRAAEQRLRAAEIPTLSLKIDRVGQLERAARLLGTATGSGDRARAVVDSVTRTLEMVRAAVAGRERPRAFWHVWDAPLITIGRGSYMHELLEIAGAENVYGDVDSPSPRVDLEDVARRDPDVVLAGPVGAARLRGDRRWQTVRAVRENRILVVDTSLVGRPSVRLGEAAVWLARVLHPGSP